MDKFPEIKKSFQEVHGGEEYPKKGVEIEKKTPETQEKSLRDLAETDFGWLKTKLDPEDYKKLIDQRVADLVMEDENIEFANTALEENIEENKKAKSLIGEIEKSLEQKIEELKFAKIDGTTGMKLRGYLFSEAIPAELKEASGLEAGEISDQQWLELLESDDEVLRKIPLTISMIDLSYLNLANRDGHIYGDNLLEALGELVERDEEVDRHGHRMGGDEFAFVFQDKKTAGVKMDKLREEFSGLSELVNLAEYGLRPNIDVGEASFGEAVKVFQELLRSKTGRERIENDKVFKEFNTVWLMIADKKSLLNKAQTRIPILMDHYQLGYNTNGEVIDQEYAEKYDLLIKYLGKGAYEIGKRDLAGLIEASGGDVRERDRLVTEYIHNKERRKLAVDNPEYDVLRDWVIAENMGIVKGLELSEVK